MNIITRKQYLSSIMLLRPQRSKTAILRCCLQKPQGSRRFSARTNLPVVGVSPTIWRRSVSPPDRAQSGVQGTVHDVLA